MLNHAIALWRRGLSIIPIPPPDGRHDGKTPAMPWREYQTRLPTEAEIREWFSSDPAANVAVVTGAISDVVVVDADSPEAARWCTRRLPYTPWQVKTARGPHLYYRHPGVRVANRARIETNDGRLAIDVRGDSGFVIAPPSRHASGIRYAQAGDWSVPRSELPVFLCRLSARARLRTHRRSPPKIRRSIGLVRDENDNAGAVRVVEDVKAATRSVGIPWLIDAHSGKGEDQRDDADPTHAMRGASAAAGAADYMLSLRYDNGAFGRQRRLSGKGRFVDFAPIVMDFDATSSTYVVVAGLKRGLAESTWRLITETSALSTTPKSAKEIARDAGLGDGRVTTTHHRQIIAALKGRPQVGRSDVMRRGQKTTLFRLLEAE